MKDNLKFNESIPRLIKTGVIAFAILLVIVLINPFVIVGPGERGVVTRLGAVQDEVKGEGLGFKIPFIEKVILVDVKVRKRVAETSAATKDLQMVRTKIALNYSVNPMSVNKLWQEVGRDFEDRIIDPTIQESLKAVTASFTAEELVQRRSEVKDLVQNLLEIRLKEKYLIVDALSITDFDFSPEFNAAIEAKQKAEQMALKAKQDLVRIKTESEQKVAQANAQAESLRLQKEQVTPALIQLRQVEAQLAAIEKWNGVMPQYVGGAPIPFIDVGAKK